MKFYVYLSRSWAVLILIQLQFQRLNFSLMSLFLPLLLSVGFPRVSFLDKIWGNSSFQCNLLLLYRSLVDIIIRSQEKLSVTLRWGLSLLASPWPSQVLLSLFFFLFSPLCQKGSCQSGLEFSMGSDGSLSSESNLLIIKMLSYTVKHNPSNNSSLLPSSLTPTTAEGATGVKV